MDINWTRIGRDQVRSTVDPGQRPLILGMPAPLVVRCAATGTAMKALHPGSAIAGRSRDQEFGDRESSARATHC
jgi:hypothetical protein